MKGDLLALALLPAWSQTVWAAEPETLLVLAGVPGRAGVLWLPHEAEAPVQRLAHSLSEQAVQSALQLLPAALRLGLGRVQSQQGSWSAPQGLLQTAERSTAWGAATALPPPSLHRAGAV